MPEPTRLHNALHHTPRASTPHPWADLATHAAVPWGLATLVVALVAHALELLSAPLLSGGGPYFDAVFPIYLWVGAFVTIALGPAIARVFHAHERAHDTLALHTLLQHTLHTLAAHLPEDTLLHLDPTEPHTWDLTLSPYLHLSAHLPPDGDRLLARLHLQGPLTPRLRDATRPLHLHHDPLLHTLTLTLPRSPHHASAHLERWRRLIALAITPDAEPEPSPRRRVLLQRRADTPHPELTHASLCLPLEPAHQDPPTPRRGDLTRRALQIAPILGLLLLGVLLLGAGLPSFFPPWLLLSALPLACALVLWARDLERHPRAPHTSTPPPLLSLRQHTLRRTDTDDAIHLDAPFQLTLTRDHHGRHLGLTLRQGRRSLRLRVPAEPSPELDALERSSRADDTLDADHFCELWPALRCYANQHDAPIHLHAACAPQYQDRDGDPGPSALSPTHARRARTLESA